MSDLSGIYSLRGFLYQIQIYELVCFRHGWENDDEMIYEGLDDIDSGKSTLIKSKRSFIQIKSGQLTKQIYYGVLSNWFLLNNTCPNSSFTLFFEEGNTSSFKDDTVFEDYYKHISSKDMVLNHPNCKHSLARDLFESQSKMKNAFNKLCEKISFHQIKQDDIYDLLLKEALDNSIKNEMRAQAFIFHFIDSLHKEIEQSVIQCKPYKLTKSKYFEIYNFTLTSVQRNKYVFKMKRIPGIDSTKLLSIADGEFLKQIKSVSEQEEFLTQNIIDELEYEIFKESYDDDESIENIDYLETSVHSRYMILLGNPNIDDNWDFYNQMISSSFSSDILEMDYRAKTGCCNYLSSSKANPENAIKWNVRHE